MIDINFVPETLEWCERHYVPPIKEYINCKDFGRSDGTNGGCWQCMELTPYQFEMCSDETWIQGLLSSTARKQCKSREEASEFIENHKQKCPRKNVIDYLYHLKERGKEETFSEKLLSALNEHLDYYKSVPNGNDHVILETRGEITGIKIAIRELKKLQDEK